MVTIAIVEDDSAQRAALGELVARFFAQNGEEPRLLTYADGADILADYPQGLDLLLMDIDMPKVNGLEAARQIRTFDREVLLVFITNLVQCALEGYAVEAMDFIVKPVTEESCNFSFGRVLRRLRQKRGHALQVREGKNTLSVNTTQITYAETQGRGVLLHLADGSALPVSESIQSLEGRTREKGFFRCHTSFLVNLAAVDTVRRTDAVVRGAVVPVSKYRRSEFLQAVATLAGGTF